MLTNTSSLIASLLGAAALAGCLSTDGPPDPEPTPFVRGISTGRNFGGGGGAAQPTLPAPQLASLWRTNSSVGFRWWDKSSDESGFRFEVQQPDGSWTEKEHVDPQPYNYRTYDYTVGGLNLDTDYCFRLTAYRDSDGAKASSPKVCTHTAPTATCPESTLADLIAPADAPGSHVDIDCSVYLEPNVVVSRQMHIYGENAHDLVIDLNHAILNGAPGTYNDGRDMIQVESMKEDAFDADNYPHYVRPENITIENGVVHGSIRFWGMAQSAIGDLYKRSSNTWDHVIRIQRDAPTHIVLDNMEIIGYSHIPLYFGPGVTNSKLINSSITGSSANASIYLGAETRGNVIQNNDIEAHTNAPQINIDSSSYNKIIDNVFAELEHGGIFLYRNCGEHGIARHQTPSYNQIINNQFIYVDYPSLLDFIVHPAVFLGERDGHSPGLDYCDEDDGIPYGSGRYDLDYARYNVVMQNQIYRNSVDEMIVTERPAVNTPNFIDYNTTVTRDTAVTRKAGCYISGGSVDFIVDGAPYSNHGFLGHCDDGFVVPGYALPGSGDPGFGG